MSDLEQLRLAPALRVRVNAGGDMDGDDDDEEEDGRGSLVVDSSISASPIRQSSTDSSKVVSPSINPRIATLNLKPSTLNPKP